MKNKALLAPGVILMLSIIAGGTFYVFTSAIFCVVISVVLIGSAIKNKRLSFYINSDSLCILVITASYLLTCLWAVDSGSALFGFVKFLPALLFLLLSMQYGKAGETVLDILPCFLSVSVIISSVCMHIPLLEDYFSVAGRLAGFLQYPNTFALLLIVGIVILLFKENHGGSDYIQLSVLLFGILYSGSRTSFILAALTIIVSLFFIKNKKTRFMAGGLFCLIIVIALVYALGTNNFYSIGRFLRTSFTESTFLGRLLYYKDGLGVIVSHPFGCGYMGYYYMEQSIQSGVYSVKFIHNELLQFMLDIGWVPSLFFLFCTLKNVFSKRLHVRNRILITVIFLHSMMDFDFQFICVFIILAMCFSCNRGKEIRLGRNTLMSSLSVLMVLSVYLGTADFFASLQLYKVSATVYPYNTEVNTELLKQQNNVASMDLWADKILSQNKYLSIAYSAKARVAYADGDFGNVIKYKEEAIKTAPYQIDEYNDYAVMLIEGIRLYDDIGDSYSRDVCIDHLLEIPVMLKQLREKTDALSMRIKDTPEFGLNDEVKLYIDSIESRNN